jgi:hypothetical protein
MEGYTLSKIGKTPKKVGFCLGSHKDKPIRHDNPPKWYSFSLFKAAGTTEWQCLLGALEVS